jgi:hypothetical protein
MSDVRVVVTGIGIVSPLGVNSSTTWANLVKGRSGIRRIEAFDTEGFETQIAGEVPDFDPTQFMDRKEARRQYILLGQQRLLTEKQAARDRAAASPLAELRWSTTGKALVFRRMFPAAVVDVLRDEAAGDPDVHATAAPILTEESDSDPADGDSPPPGNITQTAQHRDRNRSRSREPVAVPA